ncbi:MAG: SoxR reducing system RseC family protein [Proteobacteria bacterium]|nr:SoxR reducing system RseC family protein [Pseudomonadota bacterium]
MDSPVGRIVSVAPGHATVMVDAALVCARCAAGKGCGAGLLTGASRSRLIDVSVTPGMDLKPGDDVRLTLAPSHLLRAAVLAYGMPLAGVIIALGIAWMMSRTLNDVLAVTLAICGLVAGALFGRHFLNQDDCLKNLVPTVSERNA